MKKKYLLGCFTVFLSCCTSLYSTLLAQGTSPAPQTIPYIQNFSSLDASSTIFPDGFQGWNAGSYPTSSYATTAAVLGDKLLTANSSASTTSGNIHNYDGKIGFLNTGSLDLALAFAFSTTDKSGIQVQYDAMVIRNPYSSSNTRINEMVLQYRIGDATDFITLTETAYSNGQESQTGSE